MNNKKVAPRSKSQTGKEVKTKTKPISKTTKTVKKVKKSSTSKVKKTIVKKDEEEVKITKNVDMITRLVTNSNKILSDQNDLIERCKEISQKISSSDFLIDKALNKFNNDDYSESVDKYSYNLSNVLAKLKSHAEEVEQIKSR